VHNEQKSNHWRKIARASVWCLNVSMSTSPCLCFACIHVYVFFFPCFMYPCFHVSMSPCFRNSANRKQNQLKMFRLFGANGISQTSVCFWKQKRKTEFCFPWSANENSNQRLMFQQTCPSKHAVLYKESRSRIYSLRFIDKDLHSWDTRVVLATNNLGNVSQEC
jgi:hypothetical protein